ncbi:AAA domain-containing protein [Kitasatospora sp. NPDC089797]|uniref:caspase, EACC1-associated type n=1 Tax=Kitasatospora sp. NPDC089797 TaxID=3155298 RepID=UPI00343F42FC
MDNDRYALLLGVSTYESDSYHDLPSVQADLHYMRAVLESTEIGMYNECAVVAEPTRAEMLRALENFLAERQQSETALVYFSGHGEFCEEDNQLYFLTRDSDRSNLPGTAVSAEFLEQALQECRAASKIVLLDCCSSGSVVQGWTAKGAEPDHSPGGAEQPSSGVARSTLLHPTGVYFITASDALQAASAMAPPGSTLGTSRFTGEIVEGLRNGRIKDSGWISPDDLFTYLTQQMARNGVPEEQRPTKSTIRATRNLPFARSVAQPVFLPPAPGQSPQGEVPSSSLFKARLRATAEESAGIDWQRLLGYYVGCIAAETASEMLPQREGGEGDSYFLLGSGPEMIQSGLERSFRAPRIPERNNGRENEFWYGYPAISLPTADGANRGRLSVRVAPLLLQQMELAPDEEGRSTLRPSGVPSLHSGLLTQLMTVEEAAELVARWQPTWQEGNGAQMLRAVRELLTELRLPELEPLDVSALSREGVVTALRPGAHNTAMLLVTSGSNQMTQGLVDNLNHMAAHSHLIPGTALESLLSGQRLDSTTGGPVTVVASGPCNESQEAVIRSAMGNAVTVATGPPGTGKSEVVTALVETCVQAGQSVLVASTNNEAVDVVATRCEDIAPGLLIRTGNSKALQEEAAKLERLLRETPRPPGRSSATVAGELRITAARLSDQRRAMGRHVLKELQLTELHRLRESQAKSLDVPGNVLSAAWANENEALQRWEDRARRALRARWVAPGWRRSRATGTFVKAATASVGSPWPSSVTGDLETLTRLADFAVTEAELRGLLSELDAADDQTTAAGLATIAGRLSSLSVEASQSKSSEVLRTAREVMNERLQALRQRKFFQKSQKQLLRRIKGWAISTHSVRQLEQSPKLFDLVIIDEASQCSIPSILPLLFRAKRALIIGDPMQLGHIASISPQHERAARERAGLSAAWLEEHRLAYRTHSSYDAARSSTSSALLLDEHYRCHPQIADVVNGYCYAGRLKVLTDVRDQVPAVDLTGGPGPGAVLSWVDVPTGESARGGRGGSWCNTMEASAVERVVSELLSRLPADAKVGVVTPFRAQKELLERRLRDDRVLVGTVHAFQGGQRDVMVLTLVATDNAPQNTIHWVASQMNLWNVAVTRAKSQLITVGHRAFWQQHAGLPAELANRSVPVDLDRTAGSAPLDHVPISSAAMSAGRTDLADRLQTHLDDHGIHAMERSALVGGTTVDFVVTTRDPVSGNDENVVLVIDEGPRDDEEPGRHLRLTQAHCDLLVGLPSGGVGAKSAPVARSIRIPAWRILAGTGVPGLTG